MLRKVLAILCARYWYLRTGGRVRGRRYLLRKPSLLRVPRGAVVRIGDDVSIDKDARIVVTASLDIEASVFVGKNSTLIAYAPLTIGARTLLGENVSVHTEDHGPAGARSEFVSAPISIEADVWLGAGSVVLKGVRIGAGSTIGANAVVNRDVPAGCLAAGIPAKVIREL
jgi:acetyltransferase-like isoleucine patch superfamily enzyme